MPALNGSKRVCDLLQSPYSYALERKAENHTTGAAIAEAEAWVIHEKERHVIARRQVAGARKLAVAFEISEAQRLRVGFSETPPDRRDVAGTASRRSSPSPRKNYHDLRGEHFRRKIGFEKLAGHKF